MGGGGEGGGEFKHLESQDRSLYFSKAKASTLVVWRLTY